MSILIIDDDLELGMVASYPPPRGNNQRQQHTNKSFDSEEEEELNNTLLDCTSSSTRRATRFSNIKAPLSRSLSPTNNNNSNSNNLDNSHRRVVKLQRQMTQKFQTGFNTLQRQIGSHHLSTKRSLTHQRYNRKSIRDILNSDISIGATIHDAKVNGLSEDTIHRVKSGLCCLVFSCGSAALLYFMLKR